MASRPPAGRVQGSRPRLPSTPLGPPRPQASSTPPSASRTPRRPPVPSLTAKAAAGAARQGSSSSLSMGAPARGDGAETPSEAMGSDDAGSMAGEEDWQDRSGGGGGGGGGAVGTDGGSDNVRVGGSPAAAAGPGGGARRAPPPALLPVVVVVGPSHTAGRHGVLPASSGVARWAL
jgi:hypothetical protein